jgi:hypothetical protein
MYVLLADIPVVADANIAVYTNAEMEYRIADSAIISIAIRG